MPFDDQLRLIVFGPSLVGFLLVAMSCILARRLIWILAALSMGLVPHMISVGIIFVSAALGEAWSGHGETHFFYIKYGFIGLGALAFPPFFRLLVFGVLLFMRRKRVLKDVA